jgi:hypothetical protein
MKFTQPVSMQCSQEQFERDLKEPLEKLGYKKFGNCTDEDFLITNFGESPYRLTFTVSVCIHDFSRHFIDHYNPQLFISLASMSDEPNGIVGEWFINNGSQFYQKKSNEGQVIPHFWKATKEELIAYFTKTPEKEGIKSEESKTIEELFFADPIKFMDGLAYCRHQLISHIENEPKKIGVDREKIFKPIGFVSKCEHQKMISTYEERLVELQSKIDGLNKTIDIQSDINQRLEATEICCKSRIKELEILNKSQYDILEKQSQALITIQKALNES